MKRTATVAAALSLLLCTSPLLAACQAQQGTVDQPPAEEPVVAADTEEVPKLDGAWKQVGNELNDEGMVAAIDGNLIAIWMRTADSDFLYWVGSIEQPTSSGAYAWVSAADETLMRGLLTSGSPNKQFTYANGVISFEASFMGASRVFELEQANGDTGLLQEARTREGRPIDPENAGVQELTVADYGYVLLNGSVHYGVELENPNEGYAPASSVIHVVGRAEDGSISFSHEDVVGTTLPGQRSYWAGTATSEMVAEGDTIEVTVSSRSSSWYATGRTSDFYSLDNLTTTVTDDIASITTTGEITPKDDVDRDLPVNVATPRVVCILKNGNDRIVGGFEQGIMSELKPGQPFAFEAHSWFGATGYESIEVHANPGIGAMSLEGLGSGPRDEA